MERQTIDKIAQNSDDKMLLSKLWDKITAGIRRNIPANTGFLSPREQELARYLFGDAQGLCCFGGYEGAERKMLCWLPEYLTADALWQEGSPLVCLRAGFYREDTPTHRDFLGALMGAGISRETVGDILVDSGSCDFFVTAEIAPYLLQSFTEVGRTHVQLSPVPLSDARIPQPETVEIRDTLASARLDSVVSAGFRISRSLAAQAILSGKVAVDGLPWDKPDKPVSQGAKISLRGSGKILLAQMGSLTRKGRIPVVIHRYV